MAEKKKSKFNAVKYTAHRRKLLKEEMKLIYERDKLTTNIRRVRKEMYAWDKYLVADE